MIAGGPDAALPARGVLRDYLFKDSRKAGSFRSADPAKGCGKAMLEYRIVETAPDGSLSLAEITLHTGRTHQIRVQFAARKHPLYGDGKYGSRVQGGIALQSAGLQFVHPETGEKMEFALAMPAGETVGLFYLIFNFEPRCWRGSASPSVTCGDRGSPPKGEGKPPANG